MKKVNKVAGKGVYDHDTGMIEVYDKKTELTTYYSVRAIFETFNGSEVSFSVSDEDEVPSVDLENLEDE